MFWQKWKKEQEVLPESVFDRLDKLEKKMLRLNSEMLDVMTSVQILRDKVLKKIKFKKEEEEEEKPKDLYNGMLLKDNGSP